MVKLLAPTKAKMSPKLDQLRTLQEAGFPNGELAMRELDEDLIYTLIMSDPADWPPILLTRTDAGYVIIDGRHRVEAAKRKGMKQIEATVKGYTSDTEAVEEAFQVNMKHGLRSSLQTRSDYAYWLHLTYPDMPQTEIAERAKIKQPTVSIAIARREAQEARDAAAEPHRKAASAAELRQRSLTRTFRTMTRTATKIFQIGAEADEDEMISTIQGTIKTDEDRQHLRRVGYLLLRSSTPQGEPWPPPDQPQELLPQRQPASKKERVRATR